MLIVGVIAALCVVLVIGGGFMYFFWISTRPKKMTWKARIYQLSDGVIMPEKDGFGKYINDIELNGLEPYATDVVEKIDKKSGATHYWLQKMKKAVPVVTADCVEVWGQKEKWVRVLLHGDTTTLLKSGYDKKTGQQIFRPMPHDRINMIKTETEERKARIENTKDILAQITPFIVVGIAMMGLVAIVYFQVQGAIKVGELNAESAEGLQAELGQFRRDMMATRGCIIGGDMPEILEEDPPVIPS